MPNIKIEVREIVCDWGLDIYQYPDKAPTLVHFNSLQNALKVKRILEVDCSVPNAGTVCDMQEVVRCKDCRLATPDIMIDGWYHCDNNDMSHKPDHFCSCGERKGEKHE